jgi:hypothetical protein
LLAPKMPSTGSLELFRRHSATRDHCGSSMHRRAGPIACTGYAYLAVFTRPRPNAVVREDLECHVKRLLALLWRRVRSYQFDGYGRTVARCVGVARRRQSGRNHALCAWGTPPGRPPLRDACADTRPTRTAAARWRWPADVGRQRGHQPPAPRGRVFACPSVHRVRRRRSLSADGPRGAGARGNLLNIRSSSRYSEAAGAACSSSLPTLALTARAITAGRLFRPQHNPDLPFIDPSIDRNAILQAARAELSLLRPIREDARLALGNRGGPKGVFRFKTHAE